MQMLQQASGTGYQYRPASAELEEESAWQYTSHRDRGSSFSESDVVASAPPYHETSPASSAYTLPSQGPASLENGSERGSLGGRGAGAGAGAGLRGGHGKAPGGTRTRMSQRDIIRSLSKGSGNPNLGEMDS
jgi:hypothetical protein